MSKVEGYLNISIAWNDDEFGSDYVTPEQVLKFLPEGVNCDIYSWDGEKVEPAREEKVGSWVFKVRNWVEEDLTE